MNKSIPSWRVGDDDGRGRPVGRAEALLSNSRFWFEVAHGVTAAVTTAFAITWVGSSIVLASRGDVGSDVNWDLAIVWSIAYLTMGVSLVSLAVIVYAAVDYPSDVTRRRSALIVAVGCSWALCVAGSLFVPERNADGALVFLVITGVLLTMSTVAVADAPDPRTGVELDWTQRVWRLWHIAIGLLVGVVATTLLALALGSIYERMTP